MPVSPKSPSWDQLFQVALGQQGLFTTQQAAQLGYSSQLLNHYVRTQRLQRWQRGIYRIVHYPPGENEELMVAWLWSERQGVISHETALALHDLSDVLPARLHLSLPSHQQTNRRKAPPGVALHFADIPINERSWIAHVPVTSPRRTLLDNAIAGVQPELLKQAAEQALRRGLLARSDLVEVERALGSFGKIHP